ncbi:MAG: hypothetical protein ACKO2G_02555 [Verrucomicrobiales bacterium]
MPDSNRRPVAILLLLAVFGCLLMAGLSQLPGPGKIAETKAAIATRAAEGKAPTVDQAMHITLWWGCAGGLLLILALATTSRWWANPHPSAIDGPRPVARRIILLLLAAVVVAIIPRAPRLTHSFWNDEETTMQDYAHGDWKEKNGEFKFRTIPWKETIFYNRAGSNHTLNSILTRATLDGAAILQSKEARKRGEFSEAVARIIPFLASLVTVFLMGWLPARAGWASAGVIAAFVLALHPWHVRYSVEIRGYGVMLALMASSLLCLWRAMAEGRHRWWFGFAVCEAGYLLAFAGSVHFALLVNVVAAIYLLRAAPGEARWPALRSLVAWNALAAIPVLLLTLPALPQFAHYMKESKKAMSFVPAFGWEKDFLSHWLAGIPPRGDLPGESLGMGLHQFGLAGQLLCWFGAALALVGIARLILRPRMPFARLLGLIVISAPLVAYAHHRIAENPVFPWYIQFSLFALCIGWGVALAPEQAGNNGLLGRRAFLAVVALFLAVLWLPISGKVNHRLATVPRQPTREAAAALAGTAPTFGQAAISNRILVTFGTSAKRILTYAPETRVIESLAELKEILREADAEGKSVVLTFCGRNIALAQNDGNADGELVRFIESPESGFTVAPRIQGWEELFSYHVFRHEAGVTQ